MEEFYKIEHCPYDRTTAARHLQQIFKNSSYGAVHSISIVDEIVCYFVLTFSFSLEFHGRDAFVDELYVRKSYRGKGLGRAALEQAEAICRREDIVALHLEVDQSNDRAQQVYRAAGFRDH